MSRSKRRSAIDPLTVLIVDDDPDSRHMYSEYLRAKGWVPFTAADGRSGIDKATDLTPHAVVLDLAMPRVDGWTVLRQLRESSWTANIPIVIVSAVGDVRDNAFRAGCDAYLSKPCEPEILYLQIRALVRFQFAIDSRRV